MDKSYIAPDDVSMTFPTIKGYEAGGQPENGQVTVMPGKTITVVGEYDEWHLVAKSGKSAQFLLPKLVLKNNFKETE